MLLKSSRNDFEEYINSTDPRQGHICQQEYSDGVVWDSATERQDFLSLVAGYKICTYPLMYIPEQLYVNDNLGN